MWDRRSWMKHLWEKIIKFLFWGAVIKKEEEREAERTLRVWFKIVIVSSRKWWEMKITMSST